MLGQHIVCHPSGKKDRVLAVGTGSFLAIEKPRKHTSTEAYNGGTLIVSVSHTVLCLVYQLTLTVEPIAELDRFVDAMSQIRKEIKDIEDGKAEKGNNIISHAPYTAEMLMANEWNFPFTRKEAGFPMKSDVQDKYFPHVTRIDDAYGDRNLVCKFSAE